MSRAISSKTFKARVAIGERLRTARKANGLTIKVAAERAGVHKIRWLRFEHGLTPIPAEEVPELARVANTNCSTLLDAA